MKRHAASLCAVLFLCGVVIVPALHQVGLCFPHNTCTAAGAPHTDHDHEDKVPTSGDTGHDSDDCPLCQLTSTPAIAGCASVHVVPRCPAVEPFLLASIAIPSHLDSGAAHARAPPDLPSI